MVAAGPGLFTRVLDVPSGTTAGFEACFLDPRG